MTSKGKGFFKTFKSMNVAQSLTLFATLPMLVVAILMVIFFYASSFTSIRNAYEKQLLSTAKGLASNISNDPTDDAIVKDGEKILINGDDASYIQNVFDEVEDEADTKFALYYGRTAYYSNITDQLSDLKMDENTNSVVINGSKSYLKYNVEIGSKYYVAAYSPIFQDSKAVGAVMAAIPAGIVTKQARLGILVCVVLVIAIVAALMFVSLRFSNGLIKVIDQIGISSKALSEGNLLVKRTEEEKAVFDEAAERKDEFGDLVRNTETVSEKLRETVVSIKDQAEKVGTASGRLSELTSSVAGMSENVTDNVSEISEGATEQADEVQSAANEVSNILEQMDSLTDAIKDITSEYKKSHGISDEKSDAKENESHSKNKKSFKKGSKAVENKNAETKAAMDKTVENRSGDNSESARMTRAAENIKKLESLMESIQKTAKSCRFLNDSISNLSAISEENAASTQEASDAVSNISESILEVNELSIALKEVSDNLLKTLDYYKL